MKIVSIRSEDKIFEIICAVLIISGWIFNSTETKVNSISLATEVTANPASLGVVPKSRAPARTVDRRAQTRTKQLNGVNVRDLVDAVNEELQAPIIALETHAGFESLVLDVSAVLIEDGGRPRMSKKVSDLVNPILASFVANIRHLDAELTFSASVNSSSLLAVEKYFSKFHHWNLRMRQVEGVNGIQLHLSPAPSPRPEMMEGVL